MSSNPAEAAAEAKPENEKDPYHFQPPSSLLLLQTLLFFDQYYTSLLVLATFLLSIFKLWALPYPAGYWSIEFIVLIFYLALSTTRVSYGLTGNRLESSKAIVAMLSIGVF